MPTKVEITRKTIIFTIIFILSLWLLYLIKDIIFAFFIAVLITVILNPSVNKIVKLKIPRALAITIVYVLMFSIFGIVVAIIIPLVIDQSASFINNLPKYISRTSLIAQLSDQALTQITSSLITLPSKIAELTVSVFSNILEVFSVLILSFYLLLSREKIENQIVYLFGENKKQKVREILELLEVELGGWSRGELLLMFSVGLASYIGLVIIGIPYALPLAILAGLLEIVPTIGPIIAAIPPALIAFGISPVKGLLTVGLAFVIQQLENYILVPRIMQKSAGLNPIVTLLSLAVGFRLAGVAGALVSVPVIITLKAIVQKYFINPSKN